METDPSSAPPSAASTSAPVAAIPTSLQMQQTYVMDQMNKCVRTSQWLGA